MAIIILLKCLKIAWQFDKQLMAIIISILYFLRGPVSIHKVHLALAKIDAITFYQIITFTSFLSSSAMVSIHFFFLHKKTPIRNKIKIRENTDSVSGRLPLTEHYPGKKPCGTQGTRGRREEKWKSVTLARNRHSFNGYEDDKRNCHNLNLAYVSRVLSDDFPLPEVTKLLSVL